LKKIAKIIEVEGDFYDITLKGNCPWFYANGILVHNCRRTFTSYELLKDRGKDPLKVLFDTCPDAAIKAAIDAVKEGVVIQDFSEHYHLLEKSERFLENLDTFLLKIYKVGE
jgi:intein/homing endonuclease